MNKYKIFIKNKDIIKKIDELSEKINEHYKDVKEDIIVMPILNGALVFAGHILTKLKFPIKLVPIKASAYGKNFVSNNEPELFLGSQEKEKFTNKKILIIEDLIDLGCNLTFIKNFLNQNGATDIKICVLLNKLIEKKYIVNLDWVGFTAPNKWVCGFGIDSAGEFRNKPDIMIMCDEENSN